MQIPIQKSVHSLFWSLFLPKSHSHKTKTIGFDRAASALSNRIYHQFLEFQSCVWFLATLSTTCHQSSQLWGHLLRYENIFQLYIFWCSFTWATLFYKWNFISDRLKDDYNRKILKLWILINSKNWFSDKKLYIVFRIFLRHFTCKY